MVEHQLDCPIGHLGMPNGTNLSPSQDKLEHQMECHNGLIARLMGCWWHHPGLAPQRVMEISMTRCQCADKVSLVLESRQHLDGRQSPEGVVPSVLDTRWYPDGRQLSWVKTSTILDPRWLPRQVASHKPLHVIKNTVHAILHVFNCLGNH